MDINKELMGASTRMLILAVLAHGANYGYEVIKAMNREADGLFVWQEGTVYPVLHKMEKEDLVRTEWQRADTGRRRKYYYITAPGREALAQSREQWQGVHQLMLRLTEDPAMGS